MNLKRLKQTGRFLFGMKRYPVEEAAIPSTLDEQIIAACVSAGDVAYDIGANVGNVSNFLATICGPRGLVVAFEPVWPTYVELNRGIQSDDRLRAPIAALPFGISDSDGSATFTMPKGESEQASMRHMEAWDQTFTAERVNFTCELRRLDGLVKGHGVRWPDFIKIDVEGAELLVLRGASEILQQQTPVMLIEVFAPWQKPFGYQPIDVLSLLQSYGYEFLFACPNGLVSHTPSIVKPVPSEYIHGYNVVAYHVAKHRDVLPRLNRLLAGNAGILKMNPAPIPNE
jgi:FkbM family methyltransferase